MLHVETLQFGLRVVLLVLDRVARGEAIQPRARALSGRKPPLGLGQAASRARKKRPGLIYVERRVAP